MDHDFSSADLEAYLDEALPPEEMSAVEETLRQHPEMARQLIAIHGRRDAGIHTLGEIWRRHRLTCPSREQLTLYVDQQLEEELAKYIAFHLRKVRCRLCTASFEDIQLQKEVVDQQAESRQQRFLDRSSTYLRKKK